MVLRESQDPRDSREIQVPRGCRDHREQSDPQGRRVLQENQVCQECQGLTVLRAIPERKGLQEKRDTWVLLVHKVPSVTPGLEV